MSERIAKQVIVVRKDLNMRKGKMCAQSAHASMAAILRVMEITGEDGESEFHTLAVDKDSPLQVWLEGSFTKICVSVNSEEELLAIHEKAREAKLLNSLIRDSGKTEFNGVPTYTCCAIGPAWVEDVDKITGGLPLL